MDQTFLVAKYKYFGTKQNLSESSVSIKSLDFIILLNLGMLGERSIWDIGYNLVRFLSIRKDNNAKRKE